MLVRRVRLEHGTDVQIAPNVGVRDRQQDRHRATVSGRPTLVRFSMEERLALLAEAADGVANVRVDSHVGLLVDYSTVTKLASTSSFAASGTPPIWDTNYRWFI